MKQTNSNSDFNVQIYTASKALRTPAYRFTKNRDDANDLIQDTILKALKNKDKFQKGSNLKAWLYIIMRNTFISQYHKTPNIAQPIDNDRDSEYLFVSKSVNNQAVSDFTMEVIQRAFAKLPDIHKTPFLLYYEGFKYEEIAVKLSIPIGTVKNRIHVARQILQSELGDIRN